MSDFETEIKIEFIQEALMNLEETESSFLLLESAQDSKALLDKIFRLAHNLKGGSRAVGLDDVAVFTHQLENLVLNIQKGVVPLNSKLVTTLLHSNDCLVEMLAGLKSNLSARFDNAAVLSEIEAWLKLDSKPAEQAPETLESPLPDVPSADTFFVEKTELPSSIEAITAAPEPSLDAVVNREDKGQLVEAPVVVESKPVAEPKSENRSKDDEVVRVNMSKIDLLNNYVGELIVLQSVIQQQSSQSASAPLSLSIRQITKLSKDIQSLSMSLRMLPVKPLIQKLQRVVRDTAQALDKEVQLDVVGDQIDVDKSVLDRLADPLIHILRNAADHGLESKELRAQSGKKPLGHISLAFLNEGNNLVVEVKDDGKGIDPKIIRAKAIEKGIITETQELSEKQIMSLIFHAGFSTKAVTSEISGRGVGMDVVKTNVESIGGKVDIQSTVGKGSVFRIQIPLTLAVIDGLVVTSEKGRYVIPLSQVRETINLKSVKTQSGKLGIGSCFDLRGTIVPIFEIDEVLSHSRPSNASSIALIFSVQDQTMALAISDIVRAQQIVIKPLGNGLLPRKGWIGSCVLGDGLPTLIISPVDLLDGKTRSTRSSGNTTEAA